MLIHATHGNQQRPRGQIIDGNCGALFEAQRLWLFKYLHRRSSYQFSLPTKSCRRDYWFTDQSSIGFLSGCFDNPGDFITHYAWFWWSIWIQTLPRQNIGKIQPGRLYTYQNLILCRNRIGALFNFQNVSVTVPCGYECSHCFESNIDFSL